MSFAEWTRKNKKAENSASSKQKQEKRSFADWTKKRSSESSVQSWLKNSEDLLTEVQNRFSSYGGHASSDIKSFTNRTIDLISVADEWKKRYASDRNAVKTIDSVVSMLKDTQKGIGEMTNFYSQFETEDDYNSYMDAVKHQNKIEKLNIDKEELEIKALEQQLNDASVRNTRAVERGELSIDDASKNLKDLEKALNEKKRDVTLAKRYNRSQELSDVTSASDFDKYSQIGAEIENPTYNEANFGLGFFDERPFNKDPENIVTFSRENVEMLNMAEKSGTVGIQGKSLYQYMTDEEVNIYNYYLGKGDKETADEYLESLTDTLNYKAATAEYDRLYKDNTAMEYLFSIEAGLDQVRSGFKNISTDADYIPTTQTQYMDRMVYEDLEDVGGKLPEWMGGGSVGQMFYDVSKTTANMLPSILVGMIPVVGAPAGAALLGASAGGNAYAEMINLGYDKDQSRLYAGMVGASEAGLQYVMGGISALGGKVSGNVINKLVNNVDNALARTAIKLGGNMASEFSEEYLQEVLTPVFRNIAFNEENDIALFSEEALYAGFLGALTAGVLEGGGTISGEISNYKTGKALDTAGIKHTDLTSLAGTFSADSVAYQLAGRVNEKTGAYTLGRLFNEIGATLTEQNVADITSNLQGQGVDARSANILASALVDVVNGNMSLTEAQTAALEANDALSRAVVETVINPNSTEYQRTSNYYDMLDSLAREMTAEPNVKAVNDKTVEQTENAVTEQNTASEDVDLNEALVQETIASMKVNPSAANILMENFKSPANKLSAEVYSKGIEEAYKYGSLSIPINDMMRNGAFSKDLSRHQRTQAYNLGEQAAKAKVAELQAKIDSIVAKKDGKKAKNINSKVHFDRANRKFNAQQESALAVMDVISAATDTDIYVFESYELNGERVYKNKAGEIVAAPNGFYDPKDGSIHIDLNAGATGRGTMLFTAAHEFTHKIKDSSPVKYKLLADTLMKAYASKGVSVDSLVRIQIEKAKAAKRELTYEEAYDEVIADSMESILQSGNVLETLAEIKQQDKSLWQAIVSFFKEFAAKIKRAVAAYKGITPDSIEGRMIAEMKEFASELEQIYADALADVGNVTIELELGQNEELTNEESFLDSEQAVKCQIRPPYNDGNKAFNEFVDGLNSEARKTFDLFYGFYQKSRITNALSVSGKTVKKVNISSLYLRAQQWNDMLSKDKKWATAAKELAEFLPADIRERMGMHEDGSLSPTPLEEEFKMPSSLAQRLVDSLPFEAIEGEYQLGGKIITLPKGKARQSVGGEAYRRAILNETRKLFAQNKLRKVGIGTMSKDRWGSLGFLAANGKTGASGDFTTICPQMMFNRGCWYCYRRAALESGVNNKLVAQNVWYTGEILRIKDSDIEALNKNGGLRIQSFGDWMPHFSAMLADVLYDAELRGLQVKIITKEPSMINYIAALREQGVGKNLYFNLSADYTIEKAPLKRATNSNSLDAINPERPFMRDEDNTLWWKRAMTVEEAARYREKYDWVNTRIVAADVDEFIRGLKDSKVDVVTGYHGNIREYERVDSTVGEHKLNVEALGDAGMPRFTYNPVTNTWLTEYEGKTQTHKKLAQAIAEEGLQAEYYTKTCCITGRCATCNGKCGALARDFNVKNATNRDAESVAYWQKHMQYGIEPEFDAKTKYSDRDTAYMDAVNRGDMETAQRMVDEAAKAAGYTEKAHHGTPSKFTVFNKEKQGSLNGLNLGEAFYFADDWNTAFEFGRGGRVMDVYLNLGSSIDALAETPKELLNTLEKKEGFSYEYASRSVENWIFEKNNEKKGNAVEVLKQFGFNSITKRYDGKRKFDKWTEYAVFDSNQVKSADPVTYDDEGNVIPLSERFNKKNKDIRYSLRNTTKPDTFYSHMGKVIDGIKTEKVGAGGVIPYLKGRGVKDEEIKWSGIEEFLKGKKSVTKQELQEFAATSMLQIEESTIDQIVTTMTEDQLPRWGQYKLSGGKNYREIVFRMPDSDYTNDAMYAHWGDFDMKGVLAHARVQDFENANGSKTLFIEEIQSDWHNAGQKQGYFNEGDKATKNNTEVRHENGWYNLYRDGMDLHQGVSETFLRQRFRTTGITDEEIHEGLVDEYNRAVEHSGKGWKVPDAPFRNYHEFVLKRLIREAAENGYDSIGWTTAETQSERWSEEYAEGYRIEYDQDMRSFMNRFGKKWGVKVEKTEISTKEKSGFVVDGVRYESYIGALNAVVQEANNALGYVGNDRIAVTHTQVKRNNGAYIVYDSIGVELGRIEKPSGTVEIWSMPITDSMRESVMTEGQPLYQERETEGVSNRSLLANAFEGIAQNEIEQKKIAEYKSQVERLDAESQKLNEINKQIKELSFGKGARDTAKIKQLRDEATKTANRINVLDKKLLGLEASKPLQAVLQREKQKAYKRAEEKGKQALKDYRAQANERIQKAKKAIMEKHAESRKNAIERRTRKEIRRKIQKVVRDLNQFLLRPDKKKHVPINMQKAVAEALDIVNMDTVSADERVAKYDALIAKATDPEVKTSLTETRDRIASQGSRMAEKLERLHSAYEEFIESDDPDIANAYDEVISNLISNTAKEIGETPLRDMSLDQLESVYDMYKAVLTRVRDANRTFAENLKANIDALVGRVFVELSAKPDQKKTATGLSKFLSQFSWNNTKPVYAFERIGSKTLSQMYENIRKGEETWGVDIEEAKAFSNSMKEKYGYKKWDKDKEYEFTSATDKTFTLNLEEMMSIYAYAKRESDIGTQHLPKGGFIYDDNAKSRTKKVLGFKMKVIPEDATFHKLNDQLIQDIISTMDSIPGVRGFVDEMQGYLSTVMGAKGNEVSMAMYGIKLYKENNYFPLHVSSDYNARIEAKQKGEVKIKNSGFTKEITTRASAPIVLTPFMDVWAGHVNDMAMYHSFVLPLEDFYRVYNSNSGTSEHLEAESIKRKIKAVHGGSAATNYIEQLLKDINGDVRSDPRESMVKGLVSGFKKAAVMASLSVVIQQPSSFARALSMLDARDFMYKPSKLSPNKLWAEVKKYAPIAIIKEMGKFDTDVGQSTTDYIKDERSASSTIDKVLGTAPAKADQITWNHIWMAVKHEIARKNKDLAVGSEEFFKKAGERFTEVVTKTQVYDSVFSRSANMRSKNSAMQAITAFLAEPTTTLNMYQNAIRQSKMGYKKAAARTIASIYAAIALNSALASVVYAMRDDDEDETWLEKYLQSFSREIADGVNPLTYYPIIKDIWSIAQGFTVERADMSMVEDLWTAIETFSTEAAKDTAEMDEDQLKEHDKAMITAAHDLASAMSAMFGVPVGNIIREVKGGINMFNTVNNGLGLNATLLWDNVLESVKSTVPILRDVKVSKKDKLYETVISGDQTYIDRLKDTYEDEDKYKNALRTALRENDPRVKEAAQARLDGDTSLYDKLYKEIVGEGNFDSDIVMKAINNEYESLKKKPEEESSSKLESRFDYEATAQAAINGDNSLALEAKEDMIRVAVENGKSKAEATETFNGSFSTKVKEKFVDGEISASEAKRMLKQLADNDAETAAGKVDKWQYEKNHPELEGKVTYSQYKDWEAEGKPRGISLKTFTDVTEFRNNNGSTRDQEEVAAYIDSITTNVATKDALWLCFWKESTLYDKAPWHN